jgi:hypothetical protein
VSPEFEVFTGDLAGPIEDLLEGDILITGRTTIEIVLTAQLEPDTRPFWQRFDDNFGVTDMVHRGARYVRNCASGRSSVDRQRVEVSASKGAIVGSAVGAARGGLLGSPMGPAGSGWGTVGGAITGVLAGAVTGAVRSAVSQACDGGNPQ